MSSSIRGSSTTIKKGNTRGYTVGAVREPWLGAGTEVPDGQKGETIPGIPRGIFVVVNGTTRLLEAPALTVVHHGMTAVDLPFDTGLEFRDGGPTEVRVGLDLQTSGEILFGEAGITKDTLLTSDTQGRAITAAAGNWIRGRYLDERASTIDGYYQVETTETTTGGPTA